METVIRISNLLLSDFCTSLGWQFLALSKDRVFPPFQVTHHRDSGRCSSSLRLREALQPRVPTVERIIHTVMSQDAQSLPP